MILHESNNTFNDVIPGVSISTQTNQDNNTALTPHWHERMELWLILSGRMTVSCDRDIFDVQADDILLINPGQVHSCRVIKPPCTIYCLIFDINSLLTGRPGGIDSLLMKIAGGQIRFQHILRKNKALHQIFQQIVTCPTGMPWSHMRITGLLLQMLSVLQEGYVETKHHAVPHHLQEITDLLKYIHEHFTKELTLEQLAAKACMSPAYLCRWFKSAVGESPMAYVTTVRINKAHELLLTGQFSVTQVCHAVGISDLNSFNRQFQKRVGVPPSKIKAAGKNSLLSPSPEKNKLSSCKPIEKMV